MLESYRDWWRLRDLIRSWVEFREIVVNSLGAGEVSSEEEGRFMRVKARIASRLHLLSSSEFGPLASEGQKNAAQMTELLNRYRTLKLDAPPGQREREEFDRIWHQHFIFLNKMKGAPRSHQRTRLSHMAAGVPTGMPRHRLRRRWPGAGLLGFVVKLGIFAAVIYLLGRAFGIRWDESGRFVADKPQTLAGAGQNVIAGLHSIWGGFGQVFDPVVLAYGPVLTIVLVVVFLLAIGYWVFIRG